MAKNDAAREEHIREMYRNRRENGARPGPYDDLGAPVSRIAQTRHGPMLTDRDLAAAGATPGADLPS